MHRTLDDYASEVLALARELKVGAGRVEYEVGELELSIGWVGECPDQVVLTLGDMIAEWPA